VVVSVFRPGPGPHVAPAESVTRMRTRVLDEGGPRLFLFLSLTPPPILVLVQRTAKNHSPARLPSIVSERVSCAYVHVSPSAFVYIHICVRTWTQWCIYEWCMLVFLCVQCGSGVWAKGSGDDDDGKGNCDDDYDGRQRFRIPTTAIYFGTEQDENGHK